MTILELMIGALCLAAVQGHGMMLEPISRNAQMGITSRGGSRCVNHCHESGRGYRTIG